MLNKNPSEWQQMTRHFHIGSCLVLCYLLSNMKSSQFTFVTLLGAVLVGVSTANCQANPVYTTEELYNLTTTFMDNFMYPNNCAQSEAINSTLFAENVQGRIDATRDFVGVELNTEYVFGLFCNLEAATFNVFGTPVNYTVTQFVGQGNLAAFTAMIYFNVSSIDFVSPGTLQAYFNYDAQGRVYQYDAIFKWLDWQFSMALAAAGEVLGSSNATQIEADVAAALAENICAAEAKYCTGALQQYNNTTECMGFLTGEIPFGEAWQLGMDTLACRDLHVNMVPFRPDVHCVHIGPTGGGYCTNDRVYSDFVAASFFTDEKAMLQIHTRP
ncbi:hypothetical protein BX600DRAFT_539611 [Xylariales sp. PMI_506]|nr:hypothetical protein BX600DRAFT_539611 [Xylariales sp. PMI_506]